jgi:3-oxoacyl-[acyl-carrier-protein] synthase-3
VGTVIEAVDVARGRRGRRASARHLADAAAAGAVARAALSPSQIDLLLNAGLYHDRILGEPALAALIQEDIGANPEDPHADGHGTFSFDIANGACGMLTGLQIADGFLRSGAARHALVVASDADPGRRLAPGFPFAPVGAAIVCGWEPAADGLIGFRFSTPPPGPDDVGREGGLRARVGYRGKRNRLDIVEDPGVTPAAADLAADVAAKLLADAGLASRDVDVLAASPVDGEFAGLLAEHLGVPLPAGAGPDRRGRVHTAALGVALAAALDPAGRRPRTVLVVAAGAGPVAGAALLRV